jgi:hypothetical protein
MWRLRDMGLSWQEMADAIQAELVRDEEELAKVEKRMLELQRTGTGQSRLAKRPTVTWIRRRRPRPAYLVKAPIS